MPIYAFACKECGHQFDRLQKLSDPDPEICPSCGAAAIRRQVTAPSFRLAGSGWYETDFKKDGEKKHNLAGDSGKPVEKPASAPSVDKTAGSTDTAKPAASTSTANGNTN